MMRLTNAVKLFFVCYKETSHTFTTLGAGPDATFSALVNNTSSVPKISMLEVSCQYNNSNE